MAKALLTLALSLLLVLPAQETPAAQATPKPPAWSELAADQQEILAPLSGTWDDLDNVRRRKWLAIAKRYPLMKPEEQARAKRRMEAWATLSPEQRQEARKGFQRIEKLPAEKKQTLRESWEKYQQLPEEKRRELAAEAKKSSAKGTAGGKAVPAPTNDTAPAPGMGSTGAAGNAVINSDPSASPGSTR